MAIKWQFYEKHQMNFCPRRISPKKGSDLAKGLESSDKLSKSNILDRVSVGRALTLAEKNEDRRCRRSKIYI